MADQPEIKRTAWLTAEELFGLATGDAFTGTTDATTFLRGDRTWATSNATTLATEQASTSGVAIDFTSIPAGVKRITIMFNGVSTNGTSIIIVQLGDAGGFETTGYSGSAATYSAATISNFSSGFMLHPSHAATSVYHGTMTLSLEDSSDNTWVETSSVGLSNAAAGGHGAGSKALSGTLTQVRITMVNGTDAFDAGAINIQYS